MAGKNIVDEFFIAIGMDTSDVDKNINALVDNVSSKLKSIAMGVVAPALAAYYIRTDRYSSLRRRLFM